MFADRAQAGSLLSIELERFRGADDAVVLGIPRGGVIVAEKVANELDLPLDIAAAAKIGAPGHAEYAAGAVAPDGIVLANPDVRISADQLRRIGDEAARKVAHELEAFRVGKQPLQLSGRRVLLIDDGLATGLTAMAAADWVRRQGAAKVIVAVPVAPPDTVVAMCGHADEVVVLETPEWFSAVGQFYAEFGQTTDEQVIAVLRSRAGE